MNPEACSGLDHITGWVVSPVLDSFPIVVGGNLLPLSHFQLQLPRSRCSTSHDLLVRVERRDSRSHHECVPPFPLLLPQRVLTLLPPLLLSAIDFFYRCDRQLSEQLSRESCPSSPRHISLFTDFFRLALFIMQDNPSALERFHLHLRLRFLDFSSRWRDPSRIIFASSSSEEEDRRRRRLEQRVCS